jgi:ribonuclease HI
VEGCFDPETMEVVACYEGLAMASDLMLQHFKLASDCESVVRSIQGEGRGPYGQIVKEIKDQASIFESCIIVHEGRSSNRDAHSLAKSSVYFEVGRQVWLLVLPAGIDNSVTPLV